MSWSDLVFAQNSNDHINSIYNNPVVKSLGKAETNMKK